MFNRLLTRLGSSIPNACWVCHAWAQEAVCSDCLAQFARPRLRCTTCATPLASSSGDLRCGACLTLGSSLDSCHTAVDYAYPWDKLLQRLKYADAGDLTAQPSLAKALAQVARHVAELDTVLQQALQHANRCDIVIPIPLHRERQLERGFNQAHRFARALLPTTDRIRTDLLLRTKNTAIQADLPRDARLANLRHAFAANPLLAHQLKGASILLIDDVATTTATLNAATHALLHAGATHVHALVFARTT
jgi:ComF family protein